MCSTKIATSQYEPRVCSIRRGCAVSGEGVQYHDSYIAVQGEGVHYEERVCSTKRVTSQ